MSLFPAACSELGEGVENLTLCELLPSVVGPGLPPQPSGSLRASQQSWMSTSAPPALVANLRTDTGSFGSAAADAWSS